MGSRVSNIRFPTDQSIVPSLLDVFWQLRHRRAITTGEREAEVVAEFLLLTPDDDEARSE